MSSEQSQVPDQNDRTFESAGISTLANVISEFWLVLCANGVPEDAATDLTIAYIQTTFRIQGHD